MSFLENSVQTHIIAKLKDPAAKAKVQSPREQFDLLDLFFLYIFIFISKAFNWILRKLYCNWFRLITSDTINNS